ncbi:hypothetical protein MVEN_01199000 [Mycena venus]|uniref:Uncharacterized protein n=1 Tax=Mycena venus TaxID=2733690 RepID=A0A8H6Y1J2_9AGAR|nr:hypothetical protein MVEN_01199000 [Mycena venus]
MFTVGIITFILATMHICKEKKIPCQSDHILIHCREAQLVIWASFHNGTTFSRMSSMRRKEFSGILSQFIAAGCYGTGIFLVVCVPFLMVFSSTVSGYMTCAIFSNIHPGTAVLDGSLDGSLGAWVKTFYSLAVAQNIITTGLMA